MTERRILLLLLHPKGLNTLCPWTNMDGHWKPLLRSQLTPQINKVQLRVFDLVCDIRSYLANIFISEPTLALQISFSPSILLPNRLDRSKHTLSPIFPLALPVPEDDGPHSPRANHPTQSLHITPQPRLRLQQFPQDHLPPLLQSPLRKNILLRHLLIPYPRQHKHKRT